MASDNRNATGLLEPASVPNAEAADDGQSIYVKDLEPGSLNDYSEPTLEVDTFEQRVDPLLAVARRTNFFPLVSMIERVTSEAVRIGGEGPPNKEAIRFRHDSNLTFSAGDVSSAVVRHIPMDADNPHGALRPVVEIVTTFLGLTGSSSPMPLYLAEEVNHEDEKSARRDFLDIFHHRLVSILYRAVMRYSLAREHRVNEPDPWLARALSLAGMDPDTFVAPSAIPLAKLLRLGPLVGRRARGARAVSSALNILVEDYLPARAAVRVEEFAGDWVPIHNDQQCSLGVRNNILGRHAMLGGKVFDKSNRFQVVIGPLDTRGRTNFSVGGKGLRVLREGLRLLVRESLDYDVELHIEEGATKPYRLSTRDPSRLGSDTRLGTSSEGEIIRLRNVGRLPLDSLEKPDEGVDQDLLLA
jgi:type VI secretion system protein ImpH